MHVGLIIAVICAAATVACGSMGDSSRKGRSATTVPDSDESSSAAEGKDQNGKGSPSAETSDPSQVPSHFEPAELIIGALGDSITRGLNANKLLSEDVSVNWATGDGVDATLGSHLARWKVELGQVPLRVENVAVSGATSEGLDEQLTKLVPVKPSYVTMLIGANDVCQWSGTAENELVAYESRVEDALSRLIAANERVRIVLSAVPDVTKIYALKHKESVCRTIWNVTKLCPDLLGSSSTEGQRQNFRNRWMRVNSSLEEIAGRFEEHVRFVGAVATADFGDDDVAKDCFHPNPSGQKRIADLTWDPTFAKQLIERSNP